MAKAEDQGRRRIQSFGWTEDGSLPRVSVGLPSLPLRHSHPFRPSTRTIKFARLPRERGSWKALPAGEPVRSQRGRPRHSSRAPLHWKGRSMPGMSTLVRRRRPGVRLEGRGLDKRAQKAAVTAGRGFDGGLTESVHAERGVAERSARCGLGCISEPPALTITLTRMIAHRCWFDSSHLLITTQQDVFIHCIFPCRMSARTPGGFQPLLLSAAAQGLAAVADRYEWRSILRKSINQRSFSTSSVT